MKTILLAALAILGMAYVGSQPATVAETRDLEYEAYLDSVWKADPDFYMDVIQETDEYQEYIEVNGQWWL